VAFDQLLRTNLRIASILSYLKREDDDLRWAAFRRNASDLETDLCCKRLRTIRPFYEKGESTVQHEASSSH
jgi:hypothetical protein